MNLNIEQAVVLVGGKGTRLGDLARQAPKPLMAIKGDLVFLDILLDNLARQDFRRITLLAGHLGHVVVERYDGKTIGAATIEVVVERKPLGTGGALQGAREKLDDVFMLLNGDSLFDINLRELVRRAAASDCVAFLALRSVEDATRYGTVELVGDRIVSFREKATAVGAALINGGVYACSRAMLDLVGALPCSLETDVFPRLASECRLGGAPFEGYFLDIGLPETLALGRRELPAVTTRPAVFFDRDGVLNEDEGYTHRIEHFRWIEGAIGAIRFFNDRGYRIFVISNQAGVARGFYDEAAVEALHGHMRRELARAGAFVDGFYYCPYHPEGVVERFSKPHPDRKPNPGMLLRAFAEWRVDRERSFLIGDRDSDLGAAANAGIPGYLFEGGDLESFARACLARTEARVVRG